MGDENRGLSSVPQEYCGLQGNHRPSALMSGFGLQIRIKGAGVPRRPLGWERSPSCCNHRGMLPGYPDTPKNRPEKFYLLGLSAGTCGHTPISMISRTAVYDFCLDSGSRKYHVFFSFSLTRVDVVKLQSDTKNLFSTLGSLENQQDHLSKEGMATAKNVGSTVLRLDVLITNRRRMPSLPPLCLEHLWTYPRSL